MFPVNSSTNFYITLDVIRPPPPRGLPPACSIISHVRETQNEVNPERQFREEISPSKEKIKHDNLKRHHQQSYSLLTQTQNAHNAKEPLFSVLSMKLKREALSQGYLSRGLQDRECGT